MKKLGNLLSKKNISKPTFVDEKSIFFVFQAVIKEEFGKQGIVNIKPKFFRNKNIFVEIVDDNWKNVFLANSKHILEKINREIGSREVLDVIF